MYKFTPQNVDKARKMIQSKLDELKDHGITIELGRITYQDDRFTTRLKCRFNDAMPDLEKDYRDHQFMESLPPFGSLISIEGEYYYIIGYKPRARTRPVVVQDLNEQEWVFTTRAIKLATIIKEGE